MRYQWRHAMIAQTSGVNGFRNKPVPQRMHLHQWRKPCCIAKVITILAFGQGRTSCGLHTADDRAHLASEFFTQEWKGQPAKIRPSAGAAHQYIGGFIHFGKLQQGFFANNCLVQQHMIKHAPERVANGFVLDGFANSLGNRDTQ